MYLTALEDLHTRRIVGWSTLQRVDSRMGVNVPGVAIARRIPGPELVAHSDRGGQYAGEHGRRILAEPEIACRMSRRRDCWDNAPMESLFASLKKGLIRREVYAPGEEAKASLFECIEVFDHRVRRHSSPGYQSPNEFERAGSP
ncbi:integrase core domain-containing protein [Tautonia sp. JC769]|uniref:integrase core domain-containing protein n=1 Tax=Tautonia sp. JC769 TaxID=3232135 RepID=UPI003459812D